MRGFLGGKAPDIFIEKKCFVQKLNLFFSLRKSKALKNKSLIKGGYF